MILITTILFLLLTIDKYHHFEAKKFITNTYAQTLTKKQYVLGKLILKDFVDIIGYLSSNYLY